MVEAEAVLLKRDDLEEPVFQVGELGGFKRALEDGVLHPLAGVEAGLGHLAETALATAGGGGYIVSHDYIYQGA